LTGSRTTAQHALSTLRAAHEAGADRLVLCDTNGGTLPAEIAALVREVQQAFPTAKIGIHTHNDSELGVANSLAAIEAGAMHVQGTINGFGERVGNANLVSIIPNLALKLGYACMQPESLKQLKGVSQFVNEMANQRPNSKQAFVGDSAFAHKAGMHVDGVRKLASSFEHINPELVGNQRRILISELSGASNVFLKAVEMGLDLTRTRPR
jgi:2-isopropylmalate synthase